MINYEKVGEKIFSIIKGHGHDLIMFTKEGQETSSPAEARRFFCKDPNFMVTLDEDNADIKFNKNKNIGLDEIESLLKQIKNLAQTYMLNSTVKIFGQEIKPKDYAYQAKQYKKDANMNKVSEASLSKMRGTKKTSYQTLESVKVIVRHRKPVDEEVRGSRTRAIKEIFIERGEERFRFPHTYLAGARAMARHVYEGGKVDDVVGNYIIEQTANLLKLKEFYRYASKNKLINEGSEDVIGVVKESAQRIKTELHKLQGTKTYESIKARIESENTQVIEEQNADDLKELFTVKMFDESIGTVLPLVKRLVNEKQAWKKRIEEASGTPFAIVRSQVISEEEVFEFTNPQQKIGYRLQGIVKRVQEESELSKFLEGVASKLIEGQTINEFEKTIVKNTLSNIKVVEGYGKDPQGPRPVAYSDPSTGKVTYSMKRKRSYTQDEKDDIGDREYQYRKENPKNESVESDDDDEPGAGKFRDEWGRDTEEQDEWKKNVTGKRNKKVDEGAITTAPVRGEKPWKPVLDKKKKKNPAIGTLAFEQLPKYRQEELRAAHDKRASKKVDEVLSKDVMRPSRGWFKGVDAAREEADKSEVPPEILRKAQQLSKDHRCVQHIERTESGDYRISDWYDCDNTVASFENGRLKESVVDRIVEGFDKNLAELADVNALFQKKRVDESAIPDVIVKIVGEYTENTDGLTDNITHYKLILNDTDSIGSYKAGEFWNSEYNDTLYGNIEGDKFEIKYDYRTSDPYTDEGVKKILKSDERVRKLLAKHEINI